MSYSVKEIFYTLQGEGVQTGRPAVFLRFAGCNLWSGREQDRKTAVCRFCDTDFVGVNGQNGGKFETADALADAVIRQWPEAARARPYVICTGGEPLLQLDGALIEALHRRGLEIGVETNGTQIAPAGIDWLCVSPKANAELVQTTGNELKLVYPQVEDDAQPERFVGMDFEHFLLQPMENESTAENTRLALNYCLQHPQWRLSLQTHKILAID